LAWCRSLWLFSYIRSGELPSEVDLNIRAVLKDGSYFSLADLHLESALNNLQKQGKLNEIKGYVILYLMQFKQSLISSNFFMTKI
jgi:hypothetical protein